MPIPIPRRDRDSIPFEVVRAGAPAKAEPGAKGVQTPSRSDAPNAGLTRVKALPDRGWR